MGEGTPLLVLAGEPGIGKSRLLQEAVAHAITRGWTVMSGGCTRRSGQEPYAPLFEMLAGFLRAHSSGQLRSDLEGCAWLVRLPPSPAWLPSWITHPASRWILVLRREMYGNLLLTIGGTIQQILENLQFAADERLIEPLWRMQVQVDRASRATTDAEMDTLDDELLKALGQLRHLRDQLTTPEPATPNPATPLHAVPAEEATDEPPEEDDQPPRGRYNYRRINERLAATQ